jgi:Flp pilus assembly protein TadG
VRRDRGSVSVEVAILAPAFLMLVVLAGIAGRTAIAQNAVDLAAHDAARTASLARTAGTAQTQGTATAGATLADQGLNCDGPPDVHIDTGGFTVPVGQPANIAVTVTCHVTFADLVMPGVPGGTTVEATFVSPLDQYRSRG